MTKLPPTCLPSPARNVPVSERPGEQLDVQVAMDPKDPRHLVAGSNDRASTQMRVYESRDGGQSWKDELLPAPAAPFDRWSSDPSVAFDREGNAYFSHLAFESSQRDFPPVATVVLSRKAAGADAWSEPLPMTGSKAVDRPLTTVDLSSKSPYAGRLYTAWSEVVKPFEQDDLQLSIAQGPDGFRSVPVSQLPGVNLGAEPAVGPEGELFVAWRNIQVDPTTHAPTQAGLFLARSKDGGKSFDLRDVPVQPLGTPMLSFPALDVDRSNGPHRGTVYCAFTDFDLAAPPGPNGAPPKCVWLRRSTDGGQSWSDATALRRPDGALPDLPRVAVDDETGEVTVLWSERTPRPDGKALADVYTQRSTDGGRTFSAPQKANDAPTVLPELGTPLGDYFGLAARGGRAQALWADLREGRDALDVFSADVHPKPGR